MGNGFQLDASVISAIHGYIAMVDGYDSMSYSQSYNSQGTTALLHNMVLATMRAGWHRSHCTGAWSFPPPVQCSVERGPTAD